MKVLITPNFNSSMQRLKKVDQQEVASIFNSISHMSQTQLSSSPLISKVATTDSSLYTYRGNSVQVVFTFDSIGNVLFIDVNKSDIASLKNTGTGDTTIFDRTGKPIAYITRDDGTIFSFSGEPLAYLDGQNIYGFNGNHLGWFENDIVWDHHGQKIGFTKSSSTVFTKFEPFKGFKRFKPFKSFRKFAPSKPFKKSTTSTQDLMAFLKTGAK